MMHDAIVECGAPRDPYRLALLCYAVLRRLLYTPAANPLLPAGNSVSTFLALRHAVVPGADCAGKRLPYRWSLADPPTRVIHPTTPTRPFLSFSLKHKKNVLSLVRPLPRTLSVLRNPWRTCTPTSPSRFWIW